MQTAQVILTDLLDQEIGFAEKAQAHAKPMLHRAFSIFLYHKDCLLIQQRAIGKYHSGGLWTNTCCSHPQPGETTLAAAQRRLQEETGIVCHTLQERFAFPYFHQFKENLYEYEYDHVLIGKLEERMDITNIHFDRMEIASMQWVAFDDLLLDLRQQPQRYAPWFLIAAPLVIKEVLQW